MIKHLFSDMDGTILNDAGYITDENVRIIKNTNLPFTLVSARAPMEMEEVMDKLNLTAPQVGFNGGLIFERNNGQLKVLSEKPIDTNIAKNVFNIIQDKFKDVSLSWYTLNNWYSERVDAGIELEEKYTRRDPTIIDSAGFFERPQTKIFKLMMIIFDKKTMRDLKEYLLAQNFSGVSIQQSSDTYLEITSDQAIKSRGVQFIIDDEKLKPNEIIAFGDGHNDMPMLEMVDFPVVMSNALPDVLKIAKFVTKSNEEDGVGYALTNYLPTLINSK